MVPIISIIGKSGTGKTTFIEKLIPILKMRGYRIGVVKHAFHKFDIDKKGKDSWRHKAAGADTVIIASEDRIAMIKEVKSATLDSLIHLFSDVDLVITEGYKRENKPKIEIVRAAVHPEPLCKDNKDIIALITDVVIDLNVPQFGLDEIEKIADFIESNYLRNIC